MSEAAEVIDTTATAETTETASEETTVEAVADTTETVETESTSEETTETEATEEGEERTEETTEDGPSREALQKQADDNKAWATKVSQDNATLKKSIAALQQTPQIVTPEVKAYIEKLPAMYETVGETYGEEVGAVLKAQGDLLQHLVAGIGNFETATMGANYVTTVGAKHPDYASVQASPEFRAWAEAQPPAIMATALSENPEDTIWALDMFKKDSQSGKAAAAQAADKLKTDARKKNTGAPDGGGGKPTTKKKYTAADLANMSQAEYNKNYKEILANMD